MNSTNGIFFVIFNRHNNKNDFFSFAFDIIKGNNLDFEEREKKMFIIIMIFSF